MGLFSDKIGLIMGLANDRSIAWAISQALYGEGAELGFTHMPTPGFDAACGRSSSPRDPR